MACTYITSSRVGSLHTERSRQCAFFLPVYYLPPRPMTLSVIDTLSLRPAAPNRSASQACHDILFKTLTPPHSASPHEVHKQYALYPTAHPSHPQLIHSLYPQLIHPPPPSPPSSHQIPSFPLPPLSHPPTTHAAAAYSTNSAVSTDATAP